jgi:hypothetical protein
MLWGYPQKKIVFFFLLALVLRDLAASARQLPAPVLSAQNVGRHATCGEGNGLAGVTVAVDIADDISNVF